MNFGSLISDEIRENFIRQWFQQSEVIANLLDLGCGPRPYQRLYQSKALRTVGVDVPFTQNIKSGIDVFANAENIPLPDKFFDLVLFTEVLEHIPNPRKSLKEIHRVLTNDGILLLSTPFLVPEHDAPNDYYRYTQFGLRYMLEKLDFRILMLQNMGDLFAVSIAAFVRYQLKTWNSISRATKLKIFTQINNPFIFFGVFLLQKLYLQYFFSWRINLPLFSLLSRRFSYGSLGYFVIAQKSHKN